MQKDPDAIEKPSPPPALPVEKLALPPDAFPWRALAFLAWPALIFLVATANLVHLVALCVLCVFACVISLATGAPDARPAPPPPLPLRPEPRAVAEKGCAVCGYALDEPLLSATSGDRP